MDIQPALSQNPNNPEEAICTVCVLNKDCAQGKVFSVAKGFTAVTRQAGVDYYYLDR